MKGKNKSTNSQINEKGELLAEKTPGYISCNNQNTLQLSRFQKKSFDLRFSSFGAKFPKNNQDISV